MSRAAYGTNMRRSLVVTASLSLASCMATFDNYVPAAHPRPAERQARPGPAVALATTFETVDASMGTHSNTPPLPPEWMTRLFLESGGFSAVRAPSDTADTRATVLIRTERGRIDGGILGLLSAFLIPSSKTGRSLFAYPSKMALRLEDRPSGNSRFASGTNFSFSHFISPMDQPVPSIALPSRCFVIASPKYCDPAMSKRALASDTVAYCRAPPGTTDSRAPRSSRTRASLIADESAEPCTARSPIRERMTSSLYSPLRQLASSTREFSNVSQVDSEHSPLGVVR